MARSRRSAPGPTGGVPPERLAQIEALLVWEHAASNSRLRQLLGIARSQSWRYLSAYADGGYGQVRYDKRLRSFVPTGRFKAVLSSGRFEEYLRLLNGAPSNIDEFEVVTQNLTAIEPGVYAPIVAARRRGGAIEAQYSTLAHPGGEKLTLHPRAIAQSGHRYHVRAWCAEHGAWGDFALSRFLSAAPSAHTAAFPSDVAWETTVSLRISPHEDLTPSLRQVIAREYFGGASARLYPVRAALALYLARELRAALNRSIEKPPEYYLQVANAAELRVWLQSNKE